MMIAETERLIIRQLGLEDAEFILELVNEPAWLEFIGDKGVSNLKDAEEYLRSGPLEMYARLGFGLFCVDSKEAVEAVGICGLIKRDSLDDVDLGFAFLERFRRNGFAYESSKAVIDFAQDKVGLERLAAITIRKNEASKSLLKKLGFTYQSALDTDEGLLLYSKQLAQ